MQLWGYVLGVKHNSSNRLIGLIGLNGLDCLRGLNGFFMKQNYYIFNNGRLKRQENTIFFEKEDGFKAVIPIENTEALYAFGEIDFNTKLFNYLAQKGIPVHIFNYYGFYSGSYYPREYLNSGQLLVKQVNHYTSRQKRLTMARAFVDAASFNILKNLRYYKNRGKDLDEYIETIEGFRLLMEKSDAVDELMGIEGNIRNTYYTQRVHKQ